MGYYIEVEPNVKLFVEDIGTGMPIVLIHGWPLTHEMYEYQLNWLPQHGYRCICVDLRGFGKSDRPFTGYDYNRMADDIRTVISTLGLHNARLIAFSMGGAIAVRYMSRHAGYGINQLILLGAAAPSFVQRSGFPYGMTVEAVNQLIAAAYVDRPKMLHDFGELFFYSKLSPSFRDWFTQLNWQAGSYSTIACGASLRDEDLRSDLGRIHTPTTIMHGIHDKICLFPLAEAMHQGIPNSKLIPFQNSGHGVFYDELELFNQQLFHELTNL